MLSVHITTHFSIPAYPRRFVHEDVMKARFANMFLLQLSQGSEPAAMFSALQVTAEIESAYQVQEVYDAYRSTSLV